MEVKQDVKPAVYLPYCEITFFSKSFVIFASIVTIILASFLNAYF